MKLKSKNILSRILLINHVYNKEMKNYWLENSDRTKYVHKN